MTQLAAELGRIAAALCPPFLQVSSKGIQLRAPLTWCTFWKLRRLEISSNRERAKAKLARNGSFRGAVVVRRSHRIKQCSPLIARMVFLIMLVQIAGCFRRDFVECWRRFSG